MLGVPIDFKILSNFSHTFRVKYESLSVFFQKQIQKLGFHLDDFSIKFNKVISKKFFIHYFSP
jgi:hypothetical protein